MASLTLVAEEGGRRQACDDARGATPGTVGLLAFALVVAATATRWPLWAVLVAAGGAWTIVAMAGYAVMRVFGLGGDEPHPG